ncbi:MAG: metallophosphoesterase [Planctomycetes bacterium]|nr:metallophosphoesterase [Planctomycetota bacterium]
MRREKLLTLAIGCSVLAWFLSGCGGGGSSGGGVGAGAGNGSAVQIALTDLASDVIDRFEVDVTSISLVRRNGVQVETLPITTRVDFAELVEIAELITPATVPNGAYDEASITLDFATASVHIAGAAADAALLDDAGLPLAGTLTIEFEFESHRPLVVSPGLSRILTLDFDLDASLAIDEAANTVAVLPVFLADIDLQRPFVHRIRGPLESADVADQSFEVAVRPFRAIVSSFGTARVSTDGDTHFEVDGQCYIGSAGIDAMAELAPLAPVVAIGRFRLATGRFEADEVLAGTSVAGGGFDVARGVVTARMGDTLTVLGAQLERDDGTLTFDAEVTVVLDPNATNVTKQLSLDPETTDAISVGQEIVAFGELTGAPGSFQLSPAAHVRMVLSRITGNVVSTGTATIAMEVERIGRHLPAEFDFTGTGTPGNDADPAAYEIATGALDVSGLEADAHVRVRGFVSDFGAAPPDFEAHTLIDLDAAGAGP